MVILSSLGKNIGYYIVACILIALFVNPAYKGTLYNIAGASVAVSFISSSLGLIMGDMGGIWMSKVSDWSLRVMFIAVIFMSIAGIGLRNIINLFAGG